MFQLFFGEVKAARGGSLTVAFIGFENEMGAVVEFARHLTGKSVAPEVVLDFTSKLVLHAAPGARFPHGYELMFERSWPEMFVMSFHVPLLSWDFRFTFSHCSVESCLHTTLHIFT